MQDFEGKVAVITGGASGIGLGLARKAASEGMRLVLADVEQGALDAAAAELRAGGAEVLPLRTDVSQLADVEALAEQAWARFGGVHLLCNNAGVGSSVAGSVLAGTIANWDWLLGVNLWGVIHGVHVFAPRLLQQNEAGAHRKHGLGRRVDGRPPGHLHRHQTRHRGAERDAL